MVLNDTPKMVHRSTQRLGHWIQYNQKSDISEKEWDSLACDKLPDFQKSLFVGIRFGHDGTNVAMSVAIKTMNKKIFVETIDCQSVRNGFRWILDYLKAMRPNKIVIDGANGQKLLADSLKEHKIKGCILPTVKEVIVANTAFESAIYSGTICHMNQPSVVERYSENGASFNDKDCKYKVLSNSKELIELEVL